MDHDDVAPIAELLEERRHLLDVAYWMLGSPSEAESVVDETYRRWYLLSDAARKVITAPGYWLAKTAGGSVWTGSSCPSGRTTGPSPGVLLTGPGPPSLLRPLRRSSVRSYWTHWTPCRRPSERPSCSTTSSG
ncbi:ECF RNA polymerase sigma factor SigJ [Streptomyces sp. MBT84]|uniref:hypothetical protein n=1 Tax=Streptomyces sp. MBT84 TaxID=1488414 RepID=UPI001D87B688|nr:hypothetical protein [Streptomyces sp. MBT84]MBW8699569.1 ECF RNA polymerase sigma factor SigJ [Streptomyces sp. MBT84]